MLQAARLTPRLRAIGTEELLIPRILNLFRIADWVLVGDGASCTLKLRVGTRGDPSTTAALPTMTETN
jgi:hypothetical protein